MGTEQFRDDDRGYLTWTAAHPAGYVLNVQRDLNPSDARAAPRELPHDQRPASPGQHLDRAVHQNLLHILPAPARMDPYPPQIRSHPLRHLPATRVIRRAA